MAWAAAMTWSKVTGPLMSSPAFSATDLRYHSSWVLAQNGAATSFPFQCEASSAPWTRSAVKSCRYCSGTSDEIAGLSELGDDDRVEAHDVTPLS